MLQPAVFYLFILFYREFRRNKMCPCSPPVSVPFPEHLDSPASAVISRYLVVYTDSSRGFVMSGNIYFKERCYVVIQRDGCMYWRNVRSAINKSRCRHVPSQCIHKEVSLIFLSYSWRDATVFREFLLSRASCNKTCFADHSFIHRFFVSLCV